MSILKKMRVQIDPEPHPPRPEAPITTADRHRKKRWENPVDTPCHVRFQSVKITRLQMEKADVCRVGPP